MTHSTAMSRTTTSLGRQVTKPIPTWLVGILLAFLAAFASATAIAAPPAAPTGLCIDSTAGTLCATPPTANTGNVIAPKSVNPQNFHPGYFMNIGVTDSVVTAASKISAYPFVGIKKYYNWRDIEPTEGVYDFSQIESDLAYLESVGKRLWIAILDTTHNSINPPRTPRYMWTDPKYGCDPRKYGNYEITAGYGGWLPCIWNENVQARYAALYQALGKRFNNEPYFEGINLYETSWPKGDAASGYSVQNLRNAFVANALALKKAFPDKSVIQMINFASFDLAAFAAEMTQNGIGLGGPDIFLLPEKQLLRDTAYPLQLQYHNDVPVAIDAQQPDFTRINYDLGRPNNAAELRQGAVDLINPWYMFWADIEPYISSDVFPTVEYSGPLPAAKKFYDSLQTP